MRDPISVCLATIWLCLCRYRHFPTSLCSLQTDRFEESQTLLTLNPCSVCIMGSYFFFCRSCKFEIAVVGRQPTFLCTILSFGRIILVSWTITEIRWESDKERGERGCRIEKCRPNSSCLENDVRLCGPTGIFMETSQTGYNPHTSLTESWLQFPSYQFSERMYWCFICQQTQG